MRDDLVKELAYICAWMYISMYVCMYSLFLKNFDYALHGLC